MKERIEQILEDKHLTQAEFAIRAGISPATITHLFNGRNNLSETVVSKILSAYMEINPMWFLHGKGEKYRKVTEKIPLFNEEPVEKELPTFTEPHQFSVQNKAESLDIQNETAINNPILPLVESPIATTQTTAQAITQPVSVVQKQIRKIVFFYADKTFEEYYPEIS